MNMRKILAVLAATLMLCAAIPMGALSVAADVSFDFEDGTVNGWASDVGVEVVDLDGAKVLKWDASGAAWANMYNYCNLSANTEYVMTMKVKADRDTNMNFKVLTGDWSATTYTTTFDVTTEWQEVSVQFNSGEGSFVMLSSNADAGAGATYYVDSFAIEVYVAPAVPGQIVNGDFETGDATGWNCHQGTVISTTAAYNGHYGANIKGDGGWGGMLDQEIAVEAGKTYHISVRVMAQANGVNIQIQDGPTGTRTYLGNTWFDKTAWTEVSWDVVPTGDVICINFCGGGNGIAEDVYVDDVTVTELKDPSFDGYITNGDFEIGEATPWTLFGNSAISADAAKNGAYGLICNNPTGNWNGTAYQDFTVEVGKTYKVTMWAKAISQGQNIQIQNPAGGANAASKWFTTTEWTELTFEFTATADTVRINICGGNTGVEEIVYIDDVKVEEVTAPVNDAVWSVDFNDGEKKFNVGEVVAEGPDGSNCYKWDFAGGWGSNYASGLSLDATKDYTVTMKVKGSIDSTMAITLMPGSWATWWNGPSFSVTTEWQEVVLAIPAGSTSFNTGIFEFQGTGNEPAYTLYVDDIVITEGLPELPEQSYPINGDFETGKVAPWENLWSSCPTVEIVEGGLDSDYALHIVSKKWCHVRQTAIPVEPNTWYKVTAWAKNTSDMILLVKDGGDSANLNQTGMTAGEEWTEFSGVFYTGDYTTIIISLMGGENDEVADKYGTFDNVTLEVTEEPVCEHDYQLTDGTFASCETDGSEVYTCTKCGDSYTEVIPAYHNGNLEYNAAVEPTDCAHPGNIEHYYCPGCNEYFADANATEFINPWYIEVTVDCVKPEGLADCADWTCEVCGNENYGSGEHDTGVPACQDGHCSKCDKDIAGYGHQNYDGPACLPGNCYYCGEAMEPVAHENGAWAPCLEGECSYGCGLTYPATAEHVDEDGDGYCDTCWNHLAHVDEDANGECDLCWSPMPEEPVEVVYGDANGDGIIDTLDEVLLSQYLAEWDVELDEAAADANGDGIIDTLDEVLLSQYLAEWDVTLGPQG
ncbi:MAG: carbohydrate binding domain-containing protein [Clostridia bacterium]|nr:carbohydrate binding domain-containing protein [Clostridia bacterium]